MEIKTERLVIRPLIESDFKDVYAIVSDVGTVGKMLCMPLNSFDTEEMFISSLMSSDVEDYDDLVYAVLLDGKLIGCVQLTNTSWFEETEEKTNEIGWFFNKDFWNKGYCTEAASALIKFLKENYDYTKLTANCDSTNTGSWKVMEKLGMKRARVVDLHRSNQSTPDVPRIDFFYEMGL
ncbi:MAG: GNAT family N-acetyltransferase [Treponema sp.]|nr:GNAT family N-acetyltransferase [Candidatus Treponema equifaecale]